MTVVRNYRYGSCEVVKYHDNLCHPIISDALKSTVKLHDHIEYLSVLLRSSQWYSTVIPWQQKWPLESSPPFSKVSHTHQASCLLLLNGSFNQICYFTQAFTAKEAVPSVWSPFARSSLKLMGEATAMKTGQFPLNGTYVMIHGVLRSFIMRKELDHNR